MKLNLKQTKALDYLEDNVTTEIEFGGGAGGGKSMLGCYWQIKRRFKYPGTRGLIGRASLKTLKETTLNSFFEVCRLQGLKAEQHYRYNQQSNTIHFPNGSMIFLKDLFQYPSDPNFDELGSLEITDAFVDENNQTTEKAWNIVKSRIRYKMTFCTHCNHFEPNINEKEWICKKCKKLTQGLIPKMLGSCNPSKGWIYTRFYKPAKEGELPKDRQFIQALVGDNPNVSKHYRDNLLGLDEASKERLLYGNWEYDNDLSTLIQYEKIIDCFSNDFVSDGGLYITADIARFGSDSTVICIWSGLRVNMVQYNGKSVEQVANIIRELQRKHNIPNSQTICDEDGVGGGVVDILKCKGFVNNSRPLDNPITRKPENYTNLKSQCYFMLAEKINKGEIYIDCNNVSIKEKIIQELEQVKQHNMDKDGKKQIIPKDKVKELIGRSPDFSDALMMRMYFELKPKLSWVAV